MRRVHASGDRSVVGGETLRRCLVFSCALAGVVLASARGEALASCGDYVMVGGSHQGYAAQPPIGPGTVPVCSGKHCQQHIPLPAAPKPLVDTSSQESACFSTERRREADSPESLVFEPARLAVQAVLVPPDRPPRVSW